MTHTQKLIALSEISCINELWAPHPTYKDYWFSTFGRAVSFVYNKLRIRKITNRRKGYQSVGIGARGWQHLHILIMETFSGECPVGKQINHKDGNKRNNRLDNLEYVTPKENMRHSYDMGLQQPRRGSNCNFAKLKEEDVMKIREEYKQGISQYILADRYSVKQPTISNIITRATWDHLVEEGINATPQSL